MRLVFRTCDNVLTVTGSERELLKFKKTAATSQSAFDFNAFAPYPAEFGACGPDCFESEWVERGLGWCLANWGSPYPAESIQVTENENALTYTFVTGSTPPFVLTETASRAFPNLTFNLEYSATALSCRGTYVARGGKCKTYAELGCMADVDDENPPTRDPSLAPVVEVVLRPAGNQVSVAKL